MSSRNRRPKRPSHNTPERETSQPIDEGSEVEDVQDAEEDESRRARDQLYSIPQYVSPAGSGEDEDEDDDEDYEPDEGEDEVIEEQKGEEERGRSEEQEITLDEVVEEVSPDRHVRVAESDMSEY